MFKNKKVEVSKNVFFKEEGKFKTHEKLFKIVKTDIVVFIVQNNSSKRSQIFKVHFWMYCKCKIDVVFKENKTGNFNDVFSRYFTKKTEIESCKNWLIS